MWPHIGRDAEALSVGKREKLVVVQHRVEVLHPLGVHVSVKHDPLPLATLPPHVVDDPAGGEGEREGWREGEREGGEGVREGGRGGCTQ